MCGEEKVGWGGDGCWVATKTQRQRRDEVVVWVFATACSSEAHRCVSLHACERVGV